MLAAFLMSTFGIASVLLADVGTFLFAAGVLLFFIRIPGDDAVNRVQMRGFETPFAGLREGFAFLKQDAAVRTMILVFAALNFFSRISYENILSPMILSRSGSRQVLGLVSGILGFGGVIGGILAWLRLPATEESSAQNLSARNLEAFSSVTCSWVHLCRAQRTAICRNLGGDFSGRRVGPIEPLSRSWPGHRLRCRRLRSWLDRVRAAAWP